MGLNKLIQRLKPKEYVSLDTDGFNELVSKMNFIKERESPPSVSFLKKENEK